MGSILLGRQFLPIWKRRNKIVFENANNNVINSGDDVRLEVDGLVQVILKRAGEMLQTLQL